MMPFFALVMLEGRMLNQMAVIEEEENLDRTNENTIDIFIEAFRDKNCGYNDYIVRQGKTLSSLCDNDKTFEQDFKKYLDGFDSNLKELLGIDRGTDDSKYLNLDGMIAELRKKGILMQYITKWAQIDLSPYNNSEITTLEEHIKRKWADISSETAGEQYTPEDIISLIAEIVASKIDKPKTEYVSIYDPTCGGANLLFGVADRLHDKAGYEYIATYGCDWNDALFALAKIESLFREEANIKYGNTLTTLPFKGKEFDVVIANPPYGIPWSGYEKEIKNDQSGQFFFLPAVSDGQLLFLQHNANHLGAESGIVVEVNNGSSLFSGNAGSGESNIRKKLFDLDLVEAIVQLPSDEFFNTGIVTYLWILNKNKPASRRDKVILINATDLWQPLKKNKGKKRKEINPEQRARIVDALTRFEDNDIAKVYDKWHFYYNSQNILLIETDKEGNYVSRSLGHPWEVEKLTGIEAAYGFEGNWVWPIDEPEDGYPDELRIKVCPNASTVIFTKDYIWFVNSEENYVGRYNRETEETESLGNGKITITINYSKKTKKHSINVKVSDSIYKDTEIIPFSPYPEQNDKNIDAFLRKYIFKPWLLDENTVGVEVNFNKEFYVPEAVESVEDIKAEIALIDRELSDLENSLGL